RNRGTSRAHFREPRHPSHSRVAPARDGTQARYRGRSCSWRWSSLFNHVSAMVDVQIRKGAGEEAKLRRAGHLTMDDRNGLQKNGKDCRFSDNRELRSELALPKHHELMLKKCGTYRNNREGNVPTWTGLLTHQDRRRSCCWRLKC